MISRASTRIAEFIRNNNEQAASLAVLHFAIFIFLNAVLVTVMILGISAITGRFAEAVLLIASYVVLRFFSGGMHLPTSTLCNFFSTAMMLVLVHLPIGFWNAGLVLTVIAFVIVLLYAPTKDIMHLNKLGPKYTIHFKIASIVLIASNFLIQSPIMALAFIAQSISLTPAAYKAVSLFGKGGDK